MKVSPPRIFTLIKGKFMRLLICGSREWGVLFTAFTPQERNERLEEQELVRLVIEQLNPDLIIEGGAKGADYEASRVAKELAITFMEFPANWSKWGKRAGMVRNQKMLEDGKPDYILAFHRDISKSKGTADMIRRAKRNGIPYLLISKREDIDGI